MKVSPALEATLGNEKAEKLKKMLAVIEKQHKVSLSTAAHRKKEFVSTSSIHINEVLGGKMDAGFARGAVHEIYGPPSHGKTTIILDAILNEQKSGGTVLYIDAEHSIDAEYLQSLGIDTEALLVLSPEYAEQAMEIMEQFIHSGAASLIVVDSLNALIPKAELDKGISHEVMGTQAKLFSKMFRFLMPTIRKNNVCIIFITQLRASLSMYGKSEANTGGMALAYYASTRSDIRRISKAEVKNKAGEVIGWDTRIKNDKNKVAMPFREGIFRIMFGKGVDTTLEAFDVLLRDPNSGIIRGKGKLEIDGEVYFKGKKENFIKMLACPENEEVVKALTLRVQQLKDGALLSPIPPFTEVQLEDEVQE